MPESAVIACMGGWGCRWRESCGHYHAEDRREPAENLCLDEGAKQWIPIRTAWPDAHRKDETMTEPASTRGRKESSYAAQVRDFVLAQGERGATPEQIRAALPGLNKSRCKHAMERAVEMKRFYRLGGYRELLVFDVSVPREAAEARFAEHRQATADRRRDLAAACQARRREKAKTNAPSNKPRKPRVPRELTEGDPRHKWPAVLAYIQANPGSTYEAAMAALGCTRTSLVNIVRTLTDHKRVSTRHIWRWTHLFPAEMPADAIDQLAADMHESYRQGATTARAAYEAARVRPYKPKPREQKAPAGVYQAKTTRATRAINKLADQFRGTAAPKERTKTVEITGMDTAPISYGNPCRSRYEVDPASVSGLSKLPIGTYAETPSRWTSFATDRARDLEVVS